MWVRTGFAVELVTPNQLPTGRIAQRCQIVIQAYPNILVAVPSVIPEIQSPHVAPILANGEGAAERVGALAVFLTNLQDVLIGALTRQCQRLFAAISG